MNESDIIAEIVKSALPPLTEYSEENWGGDPHVERFCELLAQQLGIRAKVFVAWACPLIVRKLTCGRLTVVIRSERLDTLLVEYARLTAWAARAGSGPDVMEMCESAVLRWMAEILIGQQRSSVALAAHEKGRRLTFRFRPSPFRDETLASIAECERTAIQCFSLAHEFGHVQFAKRGGVDLDFLVDGISLRRHLQRDLPPEDGGEGLLKRLDAASVLNEIEADLFALDRVARYLLWTFECEPRDAIRYVLNACEAQFFVAGCKATCETLGAALSTGADHGEFSEGDLLAGLSWAVRARAVTRRAGILWAQLEHPGAKLRAADINRYVPLVDAMWGSRQIGMGVTSDRLSTHAQSLFHEFSGLGPERLAAIFDQQLDRIRADGNLKSELWEILIAFGCHGATGVTDYLENKNRT